MKNYRAKGFTSGIIASVSYGTNPLFALPMYAGGIGVNSVLFYRYFFAIIIYGIWLTLLKKVSLKISVKELAVIIPVAIIFSFSSLFLFDAFNYMEAGAACTILFAYPIMVALISKIFFKEKLPAIVWLSLFMAISGIVLLYNGVPDNISLKGIVLVLLSSLSYAIYMVAIKQVNLLKQMKPDKLTFYVMLFGLSVYIWNLKFCTLLQPLENPLMLACAIMLALFPTIISLESIGIAIKLIGATRTAILGAIEPLTALFIGIMLFGETINLRIACGIILILSGVTAMIIQKGKLYS